MSQAIELIKKELERENITLVIFDHDKKIFESSGDGLKPLFDFLKTNEDSFVKYYGLSWGDRVIGKAAALLLVLLRPKEVFANLLSETAASTLTNFGITFEYEKKVPYILNIKKDDMCPFEKKVKDTNDPVEAYQTILNFLSELK
ncbi:MAG: DUF1893 domain-containing protein [Caldiserica bacterium]|nr:DUF1893 domain-containing protein [Caldisericota bacterium]